MSENLITPIIMCGGSGSRLWPLSRNSYPKQFISLTSANSLLQETISRLRGLNAMPPLLICNEEHRFLAAEQLRQKAFAHSGILLEPHGRNTAPAIALAALQASATQEDPLLLVLASDHAISDTKAFEAAVQAAKPLASSGHLVTFGIVPTEAHTGYGYIQKGKPLDEAGESVKAFKEKPDLDTAIAYLNTGEYLWNSGMFLFRASSYLNELAKFRPDILNACKEAMNHCVADLDFVRIGKEAFEYCPSESIDYAVMEKTAKAAVVPLDAGWSDVGSWSSLWDIEPKDSNGNVINGDVLMHETRNSLVHSTSRLVSTVGLEDAVVIETKDAVLVAARNCVQDVKHIVNKLNETGRTEHLTHREVYRPWGKYDSIDNGERYQVKRITVKPGEKLSIQMHHHRAEHWIVVSGTAKVTNGDKDLLLTENQSTYIPVGVIHALENPGKIPLELIEVQSGTYLGEDDIVRYSDRYGRV
ncbi:mannose-1-phosphate guanylyltransferase/mannose-6-phosphate isomerase [Gallaecimonas mangrovi]|uniref:mannose-1-phosphate guanylyltransferase/mannose-6-phosphate isomerase n=1 Tax=Gallaecimonas mangrovi TaxID=2291597 RepID=UPI000E20AE20|nr:mannose-1-phosphate guanylyltransferase/mannose-6-phosphate isomerase [Gallaecimonas mangrovi]